MISKKSPQIDKISINADKIIAVASGKGGVGKTTVSINMALALAASGKKVGLLDADIYGPNVPLMLGLTNSTCAIKKQKLIPVKKFNLSVISVAFITPPDQALIWRGPMANKLIDQFLRDVKWDKMDYLIIDLPPGTGDVPLSIIQKLNLSGALIVTTPQRAAIADVKKMINMFEVTQTKILGIVDNMTHLICPDCSKKLTLYPGLTDQERAALLGHKVIAEFPFEPKLNDLRGELFYMSQLDSPVRQEYDRLAGIISEKI